MGADGESATDQREYETCPEWRVRPPRKDYPRQQSYEDGREIPEQRRDGCLRLHDRGVPQRQIEGEEHTAGDRNPPGAAYTGRRVPAHRTKMADQVMPPTAATSAA